jgi:hypothetical protein
MQLEKKELVGICAKDVTLQKTGDLLVYVGPVTVGSPGKGEDGVPPASLKVEDSVICF